MDERQWFLDRGTDGRADREGNIKDLDGDADHHGICGICMDPAAGVAVSTGVARFQALENNTPDMVRYDTGNQSRVTCIPMLPLQFIKSVDVLK